MDTKDLYEQIAKHYGVDAEEVRAEIQAAITDAYTDPQRDADVLKAQSQVPSQGEIPTPEELILYLQEQIRAGE